MMRIGKLLAAGVVFVFGIANQPLLAAQKPAMSPEQFYLNQASAEKFGELRAEAKGSFQGILLYPDQVGE